MHFVTRMYIDIFNIDSCELILSAGSVSESDSVMNFNETLNEYQLVHCIDFSKIFVTELYITFQINNSHKIADK